MVPAGDTPKATRRRVRAFAAAALVVLAIVALWPLRGYRIDDERFVEALGFPNLNAEEDPLLAESSPGEVYFSSISFGTNRESRLMFGALDSMFGSRLALETVPGLAIPSFMWRQSGELAVWIRYRNLIHCFLVVPSPDPGEKTVDEIALECATAVVNGIDREIPGVTTFYNPPARQLWFDWGKPACEKIKGRFLELFAP